MAEARRSCPSPCPRTLLSSENQNAISLVRWWSTRKRRTGANQDGASTTSAQAKRDSENGGARAPGRAVVQRGGTGRPGRDTRAAGRGGGTPARRDAAAGRRRGGTRRWDGGRPRGRDGARPEPRSYGAAVPYGITVPFDGVPLTEQRSWWEECADLGYTDLWSVETNGADGFVPLALAATWLPRIRVGTAIVPAFTRGPALLAQSAATLASVAPGRFALGVGSSTEPIVTRWNGIPFADPYKRT